MSNATQAQNQVETEVVTIRSRVGDAYYDVTADAHYPGARAEITEEGDVVLIWVDALDWHKKTFPEYFEGATAGEEGFLTEEAAEALVQAVRKSLPEKFQKVQYDRGEEWPDEPSLALSVGLKLPKGLDTPEEEFYEASWEFYCVMLNGSEPGTYNFPYFIREMATILGIDAD